MGYVYLIHDVNNNTYKIGVTRNTDSNRIKKLQTGNSTLLNMIYLVKSPKPFKLETMLHQHFKPTHVLNEWYELTDDDVKNFQELCKTYNNIIVSLQDNPFF